MSSLLLENMQEKKTNPEWKILIGLNTKAKKITDLKNRNFFNLLSNMSIKRNLLRKQRTGQHSSAEQ